MPTHMVRWCFAGGVTLCLLAYAPYHWAFAKSREAITGAHPAHVSKLHRHQDFAGGLAPDVLLSLIATWLSANFDLPAASRLPRVQITAAKRIAATRYGSVPPDRRRDVIAIYDDKSETIRVAEGWTGRTHADISIIVHEMVHHLQNLDRRSHPCPQAREKLAYAAQEKWLRLFHRSLASEFDIDAVTLKLSTTCM